MTLNFIDDTLLISNYAGSNKRMMSRTILTFQQLLTNTHSPKRLLGTPVQFLISSIIYSTNHMAVSSMHLGVWSWSRQSPELQTECQNGNER